MSKLAIGIFGGVLAGLATFFLIQGGQNSAIPSDSNAELQPNRSTGVLATNAIADVPVAPQTVPQADTLKSATTVVSPLPTSMPIGPEFDVLFKDNQLVTASHAAIEKEPRDPVWAAATEDRFNRAFAANSDLRSYRYPSVECRTTRCEIRLFAQGAPPKKPQEWGTIVGRGFFTPAAQGDGSAPPKVHSYSLQAKDVDGAAVVMMHFEFAREDPNAPAP